jgi:hypothetical protein
LALAAAAAAFLAIRFQVRTDHVAPCALAFLGELAVVGFLARTAFLRMGEGHLAGETARWILLLLAALLLTLPYARPVRVGAGDAQDYAEHIADFIAQARHGVFPVLVGQSEFASNGAFNPLRTAPYLQYAGGALDALTWGALNPFAVQNLLVILSLCGAGLSCYAFLRRLSVRREWLCLVLALLYITSPGILATIYAGDMVPTWLTLPYLPLYTYVLVRIAEIGISGPRLFSMAAVLALLWYIHAPIAMWLSFIALPVVIVRLAMETRAARCRSLLLASGALLLFGILAAYEFISVSELSLPAMTAKDLAMFRGPNIYDNLRMGWTGFLRPASGDGSQLIADLQLSLPLWTCLILGLIAWLRRGWGLRTLLIASGGLFLLLVPVSALVGWTWWRMPAWVDQITDQWPMQRFYPILSSFAPFAGLLALGTAPPQRAWRRRADVLILAAGCIWCGYESCKFLHRGFRVALPADLSHLMIEKGNAVFALYSVGMLGDRPKSFSFLPVSSEMQLRLLDLGGSRVRQSNLQSLLDGQAGGRRLSAPQFVLEDASQSAELKAPLVLPPGRNCLLTLNFSGSPPLGTLVVTGRDVWREYPLPESASSSAAVGASTPGSTLALTVPDSGGDSLAMRFIPAKGSGRLTTFARLSAVSYDSEVLPFHVVDHSPLRIRTEAAEAGWLETPRIFIAGYRATVDGVRARIRRSSEGLVEVGVPAGISMVELDYPGSRLLRASFWTSFCGWLLLTPALVTVRVARMRKQDEASQLLQIG